MTALLDLEPRDAGRMPPEPQIDFGTPVDNLHDRTRCADTICEAGHTDVCIEPTA
jgi:hypothetical protein